MSKYIKTLLTGLINVFKAPRKVVNKLRSKQILIIIVFILFILQLIN